MRSISKLAAAVALILALGACAADEPDEAAATDAAGSRNRALLDAAQQPLDRARAVEDVAAGRREDLDRQIDTSAD
jgi:hypothetical protein